MMNRRDVFAIGGLASLSALAATASFAETTPGAVETAVRRFGMLPATASCLVVCDSASTNWQASYQPDSVLFVGSAIKTFILAQTLIDVEHGRSSEDDQWAINDRVRSLSSPVFLNLSGTTPGRCVLEAMIAHSDNTATDIALDKAGPDHVRALISKAGLTHTRIPDSTRRLFSYIAGAPENVDLGWAGMQKTRSGWMPGKPRPVINGQQSMLSSATEMVRWYQESLTGKFFAKPGSLTEFKRILAMADAIPAVVPADTVAFAKGGSIDWEGFHCFCLAGQMVLGSSRVTFCCTINWEGPDSGVPKMFSDYKDCVKDVLKVAAERIQI